MKNETYERMQYSVRQERDALTLLWERMDREAYGRAIDLLAQSTLTVTSACGSSGFAAKKIINSNPLV